MKVLVTGGAGFIGSAFIRKFLAQDLGSILNFDKLTYAGSPEALSSIENHSQYHFAQADICDQEAVRSAIHEFQPTHLAHFAAETHVDRSIDGPSAFLQTNVVGTYVLLEESLKYFNDLAPEDRETFRFLNVSTDEVFGSISMGSFDENSPYQPRSPYSATKASADHLVRAWFETYNLPTMISNCSNNYGPFQFPEKLIPLMISNATNREPLPVYGDGSNVRDWLFVDDHADALIGILQRGQPGESYNVGGDSEVTNLDVVLAICDLIDAKLGEEGSPRRELVRFVKDRPGHDFRYAMNHSKISRELGWKPNHTFANGLESTIDWYLKNQSWCDSVRQRRYGGERLGLTREQH